MPSPICVECKVEMTIAKSGVYIIETYTVHKLPYKVWHADAWRCPVCGHLTVAGFGNNPIYANWEEDFKERVDHLLGTDIAKKGWVLYCHESSNISEACKCGAWCTGQGSTDRHPKHAEGCPAGGKNGL